MPIWLTPVPCARPSATRLTRSWLLPPTLEPAEDAVCTYIRDHQLADSGRNLAQYVSLALYLTPPPALTTIVDETEMAADATQVVNILPSLKAFVQDAHLNAIWFKHRPEYEALVNHVHDPLTRMVLETNVYLHMPPSAYDGRRFMVLLEPMLSPAAANARIYGNDYIVVTSPAAEPPGAVHMEQIRHTYLHYVVEPLVYARAAAMDRSCCHALLKPCRTCAAGLYLQSRHRRAADRVPDQSCRDPDDGRRNPQTKTSRRGRSGKRTHRDGALRRGDVGL